MNQTTQHISRQTPALDFAQGILEETNGAIELIDIMLREIAEGVRDEDATTNDLIAANSGLSSPTERSANAQRHLVSPQSGPKPRHGPHCRVANLSTANEKGGACPERSRRLVTQIDESL